MCNSFEEYLNNISKKEDDIVEMLLNTLCPDCGDNNWAARINSNEKYFYCSTCKLQIPLSDLGVDSPLLKKFIENPSKFKTSPAEMIKRINSSQQQAAERNKPKCPRCGSTSITAGQRGYSLLTGFLGSSSTVNRCANCGYKWKPHK